MVYLSPIIRHADGSELTIPDTGAAAVALLVDFRDIPGRGDGRYVVEMCFHAIAAALAAITEGKEPVSEGVFEPCAVDMTPIVLCLYNGDRLIPADLAGIIGLVLEHETCARITNGQADIQGLTRVFLG